MLNTIFNCLTAKRNASPVLAFQVIPKDKAIFDKYFTYYVNDGYSEDEAKLISDVFQDSADDADVHENIDIRNLQPTNYLSLCCLGVVGLYACPKGTNDNQLICKLPLETALKLADAWGICWEHTSRHFLEYYALA
mgnify:FL=1